MKIPTVWVWQMAKVGSSAMLNALKEYGIDAWHGHWIGDKEWPEAEFPTTCYGIAEGIMADTHAPTTIIIPVREPGSRAISAFFQQLGRFNRPNKAEELYSSLTTEYDPTYPDKWFQAQIHTLLGFNVLDMEFEAPYTIYTHKQYTIAIIRLEDADTYFPDLCWELFGLHIPMLSRNIRTWSIRNTELQKEYLKVLGTPMPSDFIDRCFDQEYAKHFYSPDELESYRRRMSNGAN